MKKEITTYFCDICEMQTPKDDITCLNYPVRFLTNQTDGYACTPYIQQKKLELCPVCMNRAVKIEAQGAQGYNKYEIVKE